MSALVQGHGGCTVVIGDRVVGVTPFFRKPSPSGRCRVQVLCPRGNTALDYDLPLDGEARLILAASAIRPTE